MKLHNSLRCSTAGSVAESGLSCCELHDFSLAGPVAGTGLACAFEFRFTAGLVAKSGP